MSITKVVLEYMQKYHGVEVSAEDVRKGIAEMYPSSCYDVTREQVSNALADHAAWSRITRVRRGVYVGREGEASYENVPEAESTQQSGSVSDRLRLDETADDKFFTQVGIAENGDVVVTRDSDGKVYRATPI